VLDRRIAGLTDDITACELVGRAHQVNASRIWQFLALLISVKSVVRVKKVEADQGILPFCYLPGCLSIAE